MVSWQLARTPGGSVVEHTSSAGTAHHQAELNSLLDILLAANLHLPTGGSRVSSDDLFFSLSKKYGARAGGEE